MEPVFPSRHASAEPDRTDSDTGLSARGMSRDATCACRLVCGRPVVGAGEAIGEVGTVVKVGDGLLNIVVIESFVLLRSDPKSIAGVGSAWNVVSTLDKSSSCRAGKEAD